VSPLAVVLHVAAAAATWAGQLPEPDREAGEVDSLADEILSRAEFQEPPKSLLDRVNDWISEQLARFFEALAEGGGNRLVAWAILALLVGAVVVLAIRLTRTLQSVPATTPDSLDPGRRSVADWVAEAEEHEARGDWKRALLCRYRALLAELIGRGLVDDVPGRTTGEYRGEVDASLPTVADPFHAATDLFEGAWYGDEPSAAPENRRFRSLADSVIPGVDR
jgi:hypothetical protein